MKRTGKQIFSDGIRLLLNDIRSVKWALVMIGACFIFLGITTHSICPLYAVAGYPCPGCGLTRAGLQAIRFNFAGAWKMNPFIFPVGVLLAAYAADRYLFPPICDIRYDRYVSRNVQRRADGMGFSRQRGQNAYEKGRTGSGRAVPMRRMFQKCLKFCTITVLSAMILFYIWRMIRYFPGEPPMNYYEDNLLSRIFSAASEIFV